MQTGRALKMLDMTQYTKRSHTKAARTIASLVNGEGPQKANKSKQKQMSDTGRLCASLLLAGLILVQWQVEAKTHHSKRQTAADSVGQSEQVNQRDQNNWWNLWWQQYINEAEQPTVRPLVAISYGGQTIRLPPPDLDQQYRQQKQKQVSQAANLVMPEEDMRRAQFRADKQLRAARQLESLALDATDQDNQLQPQGQQQRSQWASVKPTMIRVGQATGGEQVGEAPARNAQLIASSPPEPQQQQQQDQFGIQMRFNSAGDANQMQQRAQAVQQQIDDSMNNFVIEQQQQQLQHQMIDYEAELDTPPPSSGGMGQADDLQPPGERQPVIDSSSSNMMIPERPFGTTSSPATTGTAGRVQPTTGRTTASVMITESPESSRPAGGTSQEAGSSEATTTTATPRTTTTSAPITTTTRTTTNTFRPSTSKTQTTATTTTTTTTTTTRPTTTTTTSSPTQATSAIRGSSDDLETNVNETPISFEPPAGPTSQQQPPAVSVSSSPVSSSTTPSGRVELQGGRPATSGMMLVERPKLFGTSTSSGTTPTMTSASRMESSSLEADRNRDATSGQPTTSGTSPSSVPAVAITTTTKPTTKLPPTTTSSPSASPTTTSSMASNGTESSSTESDESEGEEEAEEDTPSGSGGPTLNSAQGTNATSSDEPGEDEEAEGDEEEDGGQTTPASAANSSQATTRQPDGQSPSGSSSQSTSGTQQPMLAMMDLERLPKVSPITARPEQTSTESSSGSSASLPPGDETPVAPSRMKSDNQFETTTTTAASSTDLATPSRGTLENEMGITMPMDPMMRMLMVMMQQQQQQLQASTQQTDQTRAPAQSANAPSTKSTTQSTSRQPPMSSQPIGTTTNSSPISTTSMSTITTTGAPSTTTTSAPATMANRKKLQPPPITRMPTSSTNQPGSMSTSDGVRVDLERVQPITTSTTQRLQTDARQPAASQPQTNLMTANAMSNLDDESGGREPKIELLNMDLVPIQRLMNQQEGTSTSRRPADSSTSVQMMTGSGLQTGREQQASGEVGMAEVEPGMRLRPITGSVTAQMGSATTKQLPVRLQQQQQQSTMASSGRPTAPSLMMPSTKNQANTVYMIMMPGGNQTTTTATTPPSSVRTSQTPSMRQMLAMFQEQQQQQQQRANTMLPIESTTTQRPSSSSTPTSSRQASDRLVESSPTSSLASSRPASGTTPTMSQTTQTMSTRTTTSGQLQTDSPTGTSPTTSKPRFVSQEQFNEFARQQQQTTTTTATSTGPSQAETVTASSRLPDKSTASSSGDLETGRRRPVTATTKVPATTMETSPRLTSQDGTTPRPTQPTTSTPGQQLLRLTEQQRHQQVPAKGKALGGQKSGSFIPSKLRNDFGSQRVQQASGHQANEIANNMASAKPSEIVEQQRAANSSNMSSALRQFGGANRMSVMKNAPVAFGRPATMMMTSKPMGSLKTSAKLLGAQEQQQQQQQRPQQAQQPRFEYGPAISVRRPDEPLAAGQMPNCTLTGKNFCVITNDYPMDEVRQAVERSFRSVRLLYEELQTVSEHQLHQGANSSHSLEASGAENTSGGNSSSNAGQFACQTKVEMLRPGWARDEISKEWLVVVNTDVFPQRVRTESCAQPMAPCDFVAPFHDSHCQQRYSLHRFIAVDPQQPSRVTTVLMRFKAGCNCFLKRKL